MLYNLCTTLCLVQFVRFSRSPRRINMHRMHDSVLPIPRHIVPSTLTAHTLTIRILSSTPLLRLSTHYLAASLTTFHTLAICVHGQNRFSALKCTFKQTCLTVQTPRCGVVHLKYGSSALTNVHSVNSLPSLLSHSNKLLKLAMPTCELTAITQSCPIRPTAEPHQRLQK